MARITRTERARREMRSTPDEEPEFQIAPMIDILLVLLVFFISTSSTEALQINREIQLPVAKDAKEPGDNPGQAIINVTWVGVSNMGGITMDEVGYDRPGELIPELRRRLLRNPMMRVLVRADRNVRYEYMRELLEAVGDAGVANVTFSVVDKELPGGGGEANGS